MPVATSGPTRLLIVHRNPIALFVVQLDCKSVAFRNDLAISKNFDSGKLFRIIATRTVITPMSQQNLSSFIWSVADLLRGDYKQSEYGKVILPFTVLRRLDCVLESTNEKVWTKGGDIEFLDTDDDLEQVVLYITEAQDRMDRGK